MYRLLYAVLQVALVPVCLAESSPGPWTLPVWPGRPPGEICSDPESDLPTRSDNVQRTTNVSSPAIYVYPAPKTTRPSSAVLICPGGGYDYLAFNKEGTEIAAWLNSFGVTGIVLKYRVPKNKAGALQDAQRALALIRSRAREWNINPDRLGVMGFSAGGNLAAVTAAMGNKKSYPAIDDVDRQSSAANFAALIYPAYLSDKSGTLAAPFSDVAHYPPTFFAVTQDDKLCAPGCLALYKALSQAGVQADIHIFSEGGHAWALRHKTLPVKAWPDLCATWLDNLQTFSPSR